jgi:molybdopterin-binding protein
MMHSKAPNTYRAIKNTALNDAGDFRTDIILPSSQLRVNTDRQIKSMRFKLLWSGCEGKLSYRAHMTLSARNRLEGKITESVRRSMGRVILRAGDNLIESAITRRSADEMKLKTATGYRQYAFPNMTSVNLMASSPYSGNR